MKVFTMLATFVVAILLVSGGSTLRSDVPAQEGKKPPEAITLAKDAKLGAVAFNHLDHMTKNRSRDGTAKIACVECHHTAQPTAEALKSPPHKTVWPADRTTTLTAELIEKDANAVGAICTDCHARADAKPKLLPEIPQIKGESGAAIILTNQQAFHRNCGDCHDAVLKAKPDATSPGSKKCTTCHKRATA